MVNFAGSTTYCKFSLSVAQKRTHLILSYVAWLAFELVFIYLYLVETKGRTLEQTAALFDGEGAENDRKFDCDSPLPL